MDVGGWQWSAYGKSERLRSVWRGAFPDREVLDIESTWGMASA
jgi:hypothetical protein